MDMSEQINPYLVFLELETAPKKPTYYELLAVEQHEQPLRIFDDAVAAQQPGARGTPASVGSSHRPKGMPTLNVGKISESDKLNAPGTVDRLLSVLR